MKQFNTLKITVPLVGLVLLMIQSGKAQGDPILFENTFYEFNTGDYNNSRYPVDSRLADLDNDNDLDIVVSQYTFTSGFAAMYNDGKGFFSQPVKYTSTEDAEGIEVGDFNNDNFMDVVVTNTGYNWEGNTVTVYLNDGTGSFILNAEYNVGSGPTGITADDFDNDNDVDLAVANYGYLGQGTTVSILVNNGDGSFSNGGTFASGTGAYRIESGFINNDNLIDLVIANEDQKVNVLLNSGGNDFSNRTEYDAGGNYGGNFYFNVELVDMDNDTDIDILYSSSRTWNGNNGQIAYFKNNGDGTYAAPVRIDLVVYTAGATDVGTGDLNEDGWPDIVGASFSGRTTDGYQVVYSNGSGGFQQAFKNPAGQATRGILIGDVNSDQVPDIITVDNYGLGVTVHLNQGNGEFQLPTLFSTTYFASAMDAADIDLDGDLDVVTSANGYTAVGTPVAVIHNNGDGTFGPYNIDNSVRSGGVQAKFRDLNGDNYPDLLFATSRTSPPYDFHTAINNGDGTFASTQTWPVGSCGWADIDAFDVDNDNDLDVIITEWLGCPGVPESAKRIYVNFNNGNGTFQPPVYYVVNPFPSHIAGADLNKDNKIDLVTGQGSSVDIHLGNGNGTFQAPVSYSLSSSSRDVVLDDFNNDSNLDIATCDWGSQGFMNVLFGNGDGTFEPAQEYYLAYSPDLSNASGITTGDVNQDGYKDIIVGNNASNGVSIYLNTGNSSFIYRMRYGIYFDVYQPFFGDFDEDGINDIAAVVGIPPSGLPGAITYLKGIDLGTIPVEFVTFSAVVKNNVVELKWSTATETNNHGFYIERNRISNVSGKEWETLGFVEGNGTTTRNHNYSYQDKSVNVADAGKIYYRIKQVDYNGSYRYSNEVQLSFSPVEFSLSQNFPNPFNPATTIKYQLPVKSMITLKVFSSLGEEIKVLIKGEKAAGKHELQFQADDLPSGVYFYQLRAGNFVETKKMILLK